MTSHFFDPVSASTMLPFSSPPFSATRILSPFALTRHNPLAARCVCPMLVHPTLCPFTRKVVARVSVKQSWREAKSICLLGDSDQGNSDHAIQRGIRRVLSRCIVDFNDDLSMSCPVSGVTYAARRPRSSADAGRQDWSHFAVSTWKEHL